MANGSGLSGLAGLTRAISAISDAFGRNRALERQSDVLRQQARRERAVASREAMDFRRRNSRLEASARARRAASGVSSSTGTPLLTQGALAGEIELGALDILNVGAARATQLQNDARLRRFAGRSALVEGAAEAGTTILTRDNFDFASSFFTGEEEQLDFGNPGFLSRRGSAARDRLPGRV